ncbi:DUF2971 domain-containing protein [Shinella oryzae]|uniref:DUF2971 domain-containing protein n=1 Tax=Shinella oryzae TaxID=2871820 RepID=A0ABY9K8V9_9HYPH|nr:DUF2971 domain-containing protein [Shinella oryzae]WLS03126.1 DUF2971 domain-containing protein [Shinella oryzae]
MTLYHYCSAAAFYGILHNREIWLSSLNASNDTHEGIWLSRLLGDVGDWADLSSHVWREVANRLEEFHFRTDCVGFCLSSQRDLLSQWRGYASNGAGFCIGFNEEIFLELAKLKPFDGARLETVQYDVNKQLRYVERQLKVCFPAGRHHKLNPLTYRLDGGARAAKLMEVGSLDAEGIALAFWRSMYIMKNPAFSEEQEFRFLLEIDRPDPASEYMVKGDTLVPYRVAKFPATLKTPIIDVILGPRNMTPTEVVQGFLEKAMYEGVNVWRSGASYR